jgi:ubiquinone/menaquinone biosynthesis C-methylase UbiE
METGSSREWTKETVEKMVREETSLRKNVVLANMDYHDMAAAYYEDDYSTHGIFDQTQGSQVRIRHMVKYLSERTGRDMWVDIGCGTGNVLQLVPPLFGNAIGVDVSVKMLEIAHAKGLPVILADGAFLPLSDNSVDVISAFSVLHHFKDPNEILHEASRVLRTGGYFYSDWDPNPLCEPFNPSSLHKLYILVARMIRGRRNGMQRSDLSSCLWYKNEANEAASSLAEYYGVTRKLDPYALRKAAQTLGFRAVDIYFHDNPDNLFENLPKTTKTIKRFVRLLLNYRIEWPRHDRFAWKFAILGRK